MKLIDKNKTVSILIPSYNVEHYLERSVQSALNQDFVREIIIVDDGSKDRSYEIACHLAEKNPIVRVYTHSGHINKGLGPTRNRGLEFASGDWIQLLDADDELLPGKIKEHLKLCNEDVGFVVGNSLDIFSDGRIHKRKYIKDPWVGLVSGKLGISSSNLFNHTVLKKIGGFDSNLRTSDEYDLMFRILKLGYEPKFSPGYLTKINQTPNSLSRGSESRRNLIENWVNLRKQIKDYLIERSEFSYKLRYHYSGAVGSFYSRYLNGIGGDYNNWLYQIYSLEKSIKIKLYQIFKKI